MKTSCEGQNASREQQDNPGSTWRKHCHVAEQASESMGEDRKK